MTDADLARMLFNNIDPRFGLLSSELKVTTSFNSLSFYLSAVNEYQSYASRFIRSFDPSSSNVKTFEKKKTDLWGEDYRSVYKGGHTVNGGFVINKDNAFVTVRGDPETILSSNFPTLTPKDWDYIKGAFQQIYGADWQQYYHIAGIWGIFAFHSRGEDNKQVMRFSDAPGDVEWITDLGIENEFGVEFKTLADRAAYYLIPPEEMIQALIDIGRGAKSFSIAYPFPGYYPFDTILNTGGKIPVVFFNGIDQAFTHYIANILSKGDQPNFRYWLNKSDSEKIIGLINVLDKRWNRAPISSILGFYLIGVTAMAWHYQIEIGKWLARKWKDLTD